MNVGLSHQQPSKINKIIYIFRNRVGGQQRRVPAIEGKTPGSKPRDLSMRWAFFCLLRPRGVRVPVPWQLVRTPRVSGLVAAAPKPAIYTTTHIYYSFRPPSTTLFLSRVQPWKLDSCMQTRICRINKVVHVSMCWMSRRGRSQEGDICVGKYA